MDLSNALGALTARGSQKPKNGLKREVQPPKRKLQERVQRKEKSHLRKNERVGEVQSGWLLQQAYLHLEKGNDCESKIKYLVTRNL